MARVGRSGPSIAPGAHTFAALAEAPGRANRRNRFGRPHPVRQTQPQGVGTEPEAELAWGVALPGKWRTIPSMGLLCRFAFSKAILQRSAPWRTVGRAVMRGLALVAPLGGWAVWAGDRPLGVEVVEWPLAEMTRYGSPRRTAPSLGDFGDLRPGDWAYGALAQLVRQEGCGEGGARVALEGQRPLSRAEAAALLQACLQQVTARTDEVQALVAHFQAELTQLVRRVGEVEARVAKLEAQAFSTTTTLSGQATLQWQANGFLGTAEETIREYRRDSGAVRMVYDVDLYLDTSFTGKDVLSVDTTVNDLDRFGPTSLSETDLPERGGNSQVVSVNRIFYQFPSGPFTLTVGGLVSQEDMLAVWPSVYPAMSVLNVLTLNGAPGAYNQNVGPGFGIWRQLDGFSLSANYVADLPDSDEPQNGAFATDGSGGTTTVQLAYSADQWTIAAIYSRIDNGNGVINEATNFIRDSYDNDGNTSAFGLSGFWQPDNSGWIPSISAGLGLNLTRYDTRDDDGLARISQSWSVGLQWRDAFLEGNVIGMAVGQAPFATHLKGGATPGDNNFVWEWWALWRVSDAISVTPALFYLTRPLGQFTPEGTSFRQLGLLIKTNINF
jgi:hypothetical protein